MKVYDLKNVGKCFVCGNIDRNIDRFIQSVTSNLSNYTKEEHPKEIERQERLKKRASMGLGMYVPNGNGRAYATSSISNSLKKMKKGLGCGSYNDSVIIVSGNCGIGNKSIDYYKELFGNLDKVLANNNCYILFVRGNNDNPSIFNDCQIDFEHVKTIPDYSVVMLKYFNCLCIGGSVSIDKEWKLSQEEQFGKKLYWDGEEPFFNKAELDEILKKYKIGCVVSSTCPSFVFPGTNAYNKSKWIKDNSSIKGVFSNERKIMDKIYDKIIDADTKPYVWIYGRFKQHNHTKTNDIIFDSLASYQFEDVLELISSYFGIDVSKKLGDNTFALDSFIADEERNKIRMPRFHHNEEEPMDENEHLDEDLEGEFEEENEQIIEEDAPRVGRVVNHAATLERLERAVDEIQAATTVQYNPWHADNENSQYEMRFEMPQYTINNGRVEMVRNNG